MDAAFLRSCIVFPPSSVCHTVQNYVEGALLHRLLLPTGSGASTHCYVVTVLSDHIASCVYSKCYLYWHSLRPKLWLAAIKSSLLKGN